MIEYHTLEHEPIPSLHRCFAQAFANYDVPMDLSLERFEALLSRRGYCPSLSMGAFENKVLVGFIANAHKQTDAYDICTAVDSAHQGQGIAKTLMGLVKDLLIKEGIKRYTLEVLTSNTQAVAMYQKMGFLIYREFNCYKLSPKRNVSSEDFEVKNPSSIILSENEAAWQNSNESVQRAHASLVFLSIEEHGKQEAYAVMDRNSGDIAQLYVSPDSRRRGMASALIENLSQHTQAQNLSMLNVDRECTSMNAFLKHIGFRLSTQQFEMLINL